MTPIATVAQRLFWAWAVQFGVAIFAAWWRHSRSQCQATTTACWLKRRAEFPRKIGHSHPAIPMNHTIQALGEKMPVRDEPAQAAFLTGGTLTMALVAWR